MIISNIIAIGTLIVSVIDLCVDIYYHRKDDK